MPENQPSSTATSPNSSRPAQEKSHFGWGAFALGCVTGGCLVPIIVAVIITVVGAAAITPLIQKYAGPEFQSALKTIKETTPIPTPSLPTSATDCGTDFACMEQAIQSCTPAKAEFGQQEFSMIYKVIGPSTKIPGNCQVSFEVGTISNPALESIGLQGQNMVCDLKPSVVTNEDDILNALESDLNCEGSLWGLLKIVRAGESSK